jgi:hypothetical protein
MADAVQGVGTWRKRTTGMAFAAIDRATTLLMVYHRTAGTDTGERGRLLDELLKLCRSAVGENRRRGPISPITAAFCDLGLEVEKQLSRMKKAQRGWGAARKIFAPANSPNGKTNTLQNYSHHDATPTSEDNYWLEALDPKHRSWGHLDPGGHLFAEWMASPTDLSFFEWVDANKPGVKNLPSVEYLAPDQRWRYLCIFGDDKRTYRYPTQLTGRAKDEPPELLSTIHMSTAHSGECFGIWVCSPRGAFYTASHKVSEFHHSSFLAGGRVLAAGEWVISGGKVLLVTNKTGHYAATAANIYSALKLLADRLDVSRTVVAIKDWSTNAIRYFAAPEFISKGGNTSLSAPLTGRDFEEEARQSCRAGSELPAQAPPATPTVYGVYVSFGR